ncbi:MAG: SPASM domain-containing protein [Saprospiraceae bacterium]|jgi:radical SAM protein with 4Fe4S-binding SPASM domain|nr:SPASM domain-containing protein [Saprospiraceae bacterium]
MKVYTNDIFSFLRKLTFRKVFNAFLVLCSYYITMWLKRPVQWGVPFTVSIEPTTACNLRCPECPSGLRAFTRDTGNLKEDFFKKMLSELGDKLMYLIFYFQGEPFINPNFLKMVSYANKKGIYTITSTNGHFLNDTNAKETIESGLDRIIISVDGTTQEVYESYRKEGDLEKVIEGTRNLVKWKKKLHSTTPHIIFQFLVVKPNEHQIPDIYRLGAEIGVDEVKLKTAQVYNYEKGNELIPTINKYSRYILQKDGTYKLKNALVNHCWKLWHACVITWDGIVVPCCFDKDAIHKMGNLNQQNFREIWKGQQYNVFRKSLLKGRAKVDICSNCSEGCKVWS